jgi:SAM-dependent methyltransferase
MALNSSQAKGMNIALAATWHPRGELPRFARLLPQLEAVYEHIALSFGFEADPHVIAAFAAGDYAGRSKISYVLNDDWNWGRYAAIRESLKSSASYIHYADMDRLLRWVETRPEEWRQTVEAVRRTDYLVIGRTPAAYATHPQALIQTEAISNQVTAYLVGRAMDVSAGSKGFSRAAAEFLIANTQPVRAIGADAEWTVLLKRAGFSIDYLEVDGLDWESADQYQVRAAETDQQRLAAEAYDADPRHWRWRVDVAMEVVQSGLGAARRPLPPARQAEFDFQAVFDVDDYLYFYNDILLPENADAQVAFLVQELELDSPKRILDLACGFGRHANRLAALGHQVTGVDLTEGFLDLAHQDAFCRGVTVDYRQADMRQLDFVEAFDRVLMMFTSFGYFEDDENLIVLHNVARALKPGGLFILDVQNRDTFLKGFMPNMVTEKGDDLMIDRHTFDTQSGRLYNRRIVIRDGVRRDKPFFVRMYNPTEIRDLLGQAGLQVYKTYGGWDFSPLSTDSRRMIIIAKK